MYNLLATRAVLSKFEQKAPLEALSLTYPYFHKNWWCQNFEVTLRWKSNVSKYIERVHSPELDKSSLWTVDCFERIFCYWWRHDSTITWLWKSSIFLYHERLYSWNLTITNFFEKLSHTYGQILLALMMLAMEGYKTFKKRNF